MPVVWHYGFRLFALECDSSDRDAFAKSVLASAGDAAKIEIAAACHLYGKVPSHNVTTEFKDTAIVASDATARTWNVATPECGVFIPIRFGRLLKPCRLVVQRSMKHWNFASGASKSLGPISQNGRLHDRASFRYYWCILKRASLSGMKLPEGAQYLL